MKKLLRGLKRLFDNKFGTAADDIYWRLRGRKWAEEYLSKASLSHPHREWAVNLLLQEFSGLGSVLEVGCASGANLYVLHAVSSGVGLAGMDINKTAIQVGRRFFKDRNIPVTFSCGRFSDLALIGSKSVDVVFTDAALIYLSPDKIGPVCGEMARIARRGCFFVEWHSPAGKSLYKDHWVHDYEAVLRDLPGIVRVGVTKMPAGLWGGEWADYGCAVSVKTA